MKELEIIERTHPFLSFLLNPGLFFRWGGFYGIAPGAYLVLPLLNRNPYCAVVPAKFYLQTGYKIYLIHSEKPPPSGKPGI